MRKSVFSTLLILCLVFCLVFCLTVFSGCNSVPQTSTDSNVSDSTPDDNTGDNAGDNNDGNTGDNTGDNTGNNNGGDTGTIPPEITEEQYAVMCKDKIEEIALEAINRSSEYGNMTNIDIKKIDKAGYVIYCNADYHLYGLISNRFYTIKFDKKILLGKSYEEIYNNLKTIDNLTAEVIWKSCLQPEISEELYNEFCDYIKAQSYTYGEEVIDFSAIDKNQLEIINVTNSFITGGRRSFGFKVLDTKSKKIYEGSIMGALGSSAVDDQIIELMGKTTNIFEITDVSDFEEFEFGITAKKTNDQ